MIMPFSVVPPSEFIDRLNLLCEQLGQTTKYSPNKDLIFLSRLMDYLSSYVREHQKEQWRVDICGLSILRYCYKYNKKLTWPMSDQLKNIKERYDTRFKDAPSLTPYEKAFYDAFNHYWNEVMNPKEVDHALGEPLFEQVCNAIKQLER